MTQPFPEEKVEVNIEEEQALQNKRARKMILNEGRGGDLPMIIHQGGWGERKVGA